MWKRSLRHSFLFLSSRIQGVTMRLSLWAGLGEMGVKKRSWSCCIQRWRSRQTESCCPFLHHCGVWNRGCSLDGMACVEKQHLLTKLVSRNLPYQALGKIWRLIIGQQQAFLASEDALNFGWAVVAGVTTWSKEAESSMTQWHNKMQLSKSSRSTGKKTYTFKPFFGWVLNYPQKHTSSLAFMPGENKSNPMAGIRKKIVWNKL